MNIFSKFIQKINAIPKIYNNFGLDGLLFSTLRNIGFDIKYQSIIDKRKESIEKKIMIKTNKTIIDGPYKNTQFSCKTNWGGYDWSSKLLGYYENQVQNKIIDIKNKYDLKNIINFGGSDGYHVIGLLKNSHFEKGLIFEKDNKNIEYLYENIQLNNIKSNIFLEKEANFKKIK